MISVLRNTLSRMAALFAFVTLVHTSAADLPATPEEAAKRQTENAARKAAGLPTREFRQLFRAYEPTEAGFTIDQTHGRDDKFLDATISFMLPLFHNVAPPPQRTYEQTSFTRPWAYAPYRFYFAMTDRFGQFVYTRESSPVINKRFNPLIAMRWWEKAPGDGGKLTSEDNFFEVVYAHESNGQSVDSEVQYNAQVTAYLEESSNLSPDEQLRRAHRSARDNISRGWDYVGFQFARDWDTPAVAGTLALRARANVYLGGAFQQHIEEYNDWEVDPDHPAVRFGGSPRKRSDYDGISGRLTYVSRARHAANGLDGRCAITWTTGYAHLLRNNTVKVEVGFSMYAMPFLLWYRTGYNSDLIDYYRRDSSFGLKMSFWRF